MHPLTSNINPLPIILNRISLVLGSKTCSLVALSDLSFILAFSLGPFRFTPTPIPRLIYGSLIFDNRALNFARSDNWSVEMFVLALETSLVAADSDFLDVLGRFTAGTTATEAFRWALAVGAPAAVPFRMAACCRNRLYCLVKSYSSHSPIHNTLLDS